MPDPDPSGETARGAPAAGSGEERGDADWWIAAMHRAQSSGAWGEAAEACRRAGDVLVARGEIDRAVRVLRSGSQVARAAHLLARHGRTNEAIRLYEELGDLGAAAEIARETGQTRQHHAFLARRAERGGELLEAAGHYEAAGDAFSAIRVFELAGQPARAAAAAERGELWDSAAQLHERLGDFDRAAACLRALGREQEARAVLRRSATRDVSIRTRAAQAKYFEAAVAVLAKARRGARDRYPEAVSYLRRVAPDHPEYMAARTMLGEVLAEMGKPQEALAALQELFSGVAPDARFVPAMYQYGRLLEREGHFAGARNAYRTVYAFEPSHRDVALRLERLRETDRSLETTRRTGSTLSVTPRSLPVVVTGPSARGASEAGSALTRDLLLPGVPASSERQPSPRTSGSAVPTPSTPPALKPSSTEDPPAPDPRVGTVLRDRFRLERRIGRGAQATVYLARDQVLDREVAIKVLAHGMDGRRDALSRFLREARLAARVHHPSSISIFDFGREHGLTFIAMEYFRGRTIRDLLRRGSLDPYLALRIARDVAGALGAVHAAGIVHRDVKPTNVMVDRAARVRLTDFGVARFASEDEHAGMMVGTMKYMAPEQARGYDTDRRADIFSLGVLLWEMLVGRAPFGGTIEALTARVGKPPPELPADLEVPFDVRAILRRAMARRPADRYPSVEPMLDALGRAAVRLRAERAKPAGEGGPEA